MLIANVKPVVTWVFRMIKIPMTILYESVDFIKVIRIKMFALYAEVPFVCLGYFAVVAQCWIIALTLWLDKVLDFAPRLPASVSKLIELQKFSQLVCISTLRSSLTCLCNCLMSIFTAESLF